MLRTEVDWRGGKVEYWELDSVDLNSPLGTQLDALDEDLAKVSYPGGVLLDVGWYGGRTKKGAFGIYVVKDQDWQEPLIWESYSWNDDLRAAIVSAVRFVGQYLEQDVESK